MPIGRIALRVSFELLDEIDRRAHAESRSRTNWITRVLCEVAPLPFSTIKVLQMTAIDRREKMLSFRLPPTVVVKLDAVATEESRTRSDVMLRVLTAAVRGDWNERFKANTRKQRQPPAEAPDTGVFA